MPDTTDTTVFKNTLTTLQIWNAELYQAFTKQRERVFEEEESEEESLHRRNRLIWIQQKLAKEYQSIAEMWHWICLERYENVDEFVLPDNILDPTYDAVKRAHEWLYHRDVCIPQGLDYCSCPPA